MAEFEVLMVSIDWESPDKIRAVIPAKRNLEASNITKQEYANSFFTTTFEYDIVIYTKEDGHYFQFAIRSKNTPLIKTIDGRWSKKNTLTRIDDDLWIIKGDWCVGATGKGYHLCPSINSIGKIELAFIVEETSLIREFITIDINNDIEDFDFEQLKADFEGELWNLITSKKSRVTTDKVDYRYGNRIIRFPENKLIIDFINAFEQISKNPKHELSSSSENRKIEKVIPIVETYRKISTSGMSKILPSKAVSEIYDVYENRAICSMLNRIYFILSNNTKNTSAQIKKLQRDVELHLRKIELLEDPDPKVNIEDVKQEIEYQKEKVAIITHKWNEINNRFNVFPDIVYASIKVTIKNPVYRNPNSFWCSTSISNWCIFVFPVNVIPILEVNCAYQLDIVFTETGSQTTNSGKEYPVFTIDQIKKIEGLEVITEKNILDRQVSNYKIFVANNFSQKSIMDDKEKNKFEIERKEQITTLNKKLKQLYSKIKNIQNFNNEQVVLISEIENQIKSIFFRKIRWRNFQGFKPSMTFIQNINYRNILRYYNDILKSEGIDIEIFDLYENVTNYGIREMPQVYELWCLITLLKILEENFHFIPEKNDLNLLLKTLDSKKLKVEDYIKFNFSQNLADRKVILHYQKSLADGKRPDFILEIYNGTRKINLILDSKFKNYNYKQTIVYESLAMNEKYGNTVNNYVFVLHPCKDGAFENRNVKYTNLGGDRIYYNTGAIRNQKFPFHKFGFIELKPNTTDSLKKLLGMGLEYLLESNKNAKQDRLIDPIPEFPLFCISCGGVDVSKSDNIRGDNRHYYICTCNNLKCGLITHIDYCWNCKTKLFKHGSFWDYHLESTNNTMDIRCPNCGLTMADMPR